ncbi:uroporphyrinogen-III synthase [Bacillus spongiae]|uniref:Uroporphyrinogen-III synthase n=1 Tax=Bacillus spongiae TaxID=2683610 RepID=A0ABU8H8Y3_9BACI
MTSSLPLSGRDILITRSVEQSVSFAQYIEKQGGIAHAVPLLAFRSNRDRKEKVTMDHIFQYDWMIFTSKNAVDYFQQTLSHYSLSLSNLQAKVGAVGSKTASYLQSKGIKVDFCPQNFTAEDFAYEFVQRNMKPNKVLIPKGSLAGQSIQTIFHAHHICCDELIVYCTYTPENSLDELQHLLTSKKIDAITFTSSSAVRFFMKALQKRGLSIPETVYACIGPKTKATAESLGLVVQISPNIYTIEEMMKALVNYYQHT